MLKIRAVAALGSLLLGCAGAHAQEAYFTRYVAFGDSLTDNGRIPRETGFDVSGLFKDLFNLKIYEGGRWSNAPTYFEVVPGLIGVPYRAGDDFAIGAARAIRQDPDPILSPAFARGFPDQVDQAIARIGRFGPRDLVNIWIGYNDIAPVLAGTSAEKAASVRTVVANTTDAIGRLAGVGAREFVVFNQKLDRVGVYQVGPQIIPIGGNEIAASINTDLLAALAPLSAQGLNIRYYDVAALFARLRADPVAYGFGPDALVPCTQVPACAANGTDNGGAIENRYLTVDGVHNTGRTNTWIAAFLANQLNAPLTLGPQGELGQAAGLAFGSALMGRLDAERRRNLLPSVPGQYAADLPNRRPPSLIPVQVGSPLSLFALGTYAALDRTARNSAQGSLGNTYGADFGGVTAGLQYQASPNLVLGAAFNYLSTAIDLRGLSNGRIDLDSFQGGAFASYTTPSLFLDAAVTYGSNRYTVDRPGVLNDRLSARPSGDTFTASARAGYLFDLGSLRAGPIAEMAYARVHVNAYRESGDPLLTIGVRAQNLDGLTVGGGVQLRTALPLLSGAVSPFVNLTAQHDVLDGVRTVASFQTYAPALLIRTRTGRQGDDVYGRVAGGLDIDLGNGLSGVVTGSTSFARSGGDDRTVTAGLRYRF
ncbi:autotransporter domain-containing protein [Methylobacterium oxalidis]|uniref:autotransporter domain-containing protein n=1 Tax=Methylobacterium oxalidis TaxID=944322 RepID=UPI0033156DD8